MREPAQIRKAAERVKTECGLHREMGSLQIGDSEEFAADLELLADYALSILGPQDSEHDLVTLDCGCQRTRGWRCPVHSQP